MRGFITRTGQLIAIQGASSPNKGINLDPVRSEYCFEIIDVSRLLTLNEINSGIRGALYKTYKNRDPPRAVSNIISSHKDSNGQDMFTMRKIPYDDYDEVQRVEVAANLVEKIVPQTVAEWKYRKMALNFSKNEVKVITPYFDSLFKNAMDSDKAAREGYNAQLPDRKKAEAKKLFDNYTQLMKIDGVAKGKK